MANELHIVKLLLISMILSLVSSFIVFAQSIDPKFQAVFVNGVSRKINWTSSKPTFEILIVGNNRSLLNELKKLAEARQINGKKVNVVMTTDKVPSSLAQDIVFVTEKGKSQLESILISASADTMIMSAFKNGIESGSFLNFFMNGNKISFDLNRTAMEKTNLKATEDLVKLATNVK